jgi:UDP-N-acetylglucosamine acyltransferase
MAKNIHETAIIFPNVLIGDNVTIGPYAVIGGMPQVKADRDAGHGVVIGEGAYIGPHCQIDSGHKDRTRIGERAYLMGNVHVGHDCIIEPDVTLSQGVVLAGHVRVCEGATLGIGATVHQHQIIGHYCMIGMGSVVNRRGFSSLVLPGQTWAGNPAKYISVNKIGMQRAGVSWADLQRLNDKYLYMYPVAVANDGPTGGGASL